jgi:hypothetical protein
MTYQSKNEGVALLRPVVLHFGGIQDGRTLRLNVAAC